MMIRMSSIWTGTATSLSDRGLGKHSSIIRAWRRGVNAGEGRGRSRPDELLRDPGVCLVGPILVVYLRLSCHETPKRSVSQPKRALKP